MATILGIGVAVRDIILDLPHYPEENSENRAEHCQTRSGGNALNTLNVLSQLGHHCHWSGTLADDAASQGIRNTLNTKNIQHPTSQTLTDSTTPTSYILRNTNNGSRTITHYRQLSELNAPIFLQQVDLSLFDWLHFEARNISQTRNIIQSIKQQRPDLPISIEFEKKRPGDERLLFDFGEPLIFSKSYVQERSKACDPFRFLETMSAQLPRRIIICPWGEEGAYAIDQESVLHHQPTVDISVITDSIGAGDAFNAGIIHRLLQRKTLPETLQYACQLASYKCQVDGFNAIQQP